MCYSSSSSTASSAPLATLVEAVRDGCSYKDYRASELFRLATDTGPAEDMFRLRVFAIEKCSLALSALGCVGAEPSCAVDLSSAQLVDGMLT